jgi:hypothetical protein
MSVPVRLKPQVIGGTTVPVIVGVRVRAPVHAFVGIETLHGMQVAPVVNHRAAANSQH